MPSAVRISSGRHTFKVPKGSEELVEELLDEAGFTDLTLTINTGEALKGSHHLQGIRVPADLEGERTIRLRLQPGSNKTNFEVLFSVPREFAPRDFLKKLQEAEGRLDEKDELDRVLKKLHKLRGVVPDSQFIVGKLTKAQLQTAGFQSHNETGEALELAARHKQAVVSVGSYATYAWLPDFGLPSVKSPVAVAPQQKEQVTIPPAVSTHPKAGDGKSHMPIIPSASLDAGASQSNRQYRGGRIPTVDPEKVLELLFKHFKGQKFLMVNIDLPTSQKVGYPSRNALRQMLARQAVSEKVIRQVRDPRYPKLNAYEWVEDFIQKMNPAPLPPPELPSEPLTPSSIQATSISAEEPTTPLQIEEDLSTLTIPELERLVTELTTGQDLLEENIAQLELDLENKRLELGQIQDRLGLVQQALQSAKKRKEEEEGVNALLEMVEGLSSEAKKIFLQKLGQK